MTCSCRTQGGSLSDDLVVHLRGGFSKDMDSRGGLSDALDLRGGDVFLPHSRGGLSDDLVHLRGGFSKDMDSKGK